MIRAGWTRARKSSASLCECGKGIGWMARTQIQVPPWEAAGPPVQERFEFCRQSTRLPEGRRRRAARDKPLPGEMSFFKATRMVSRTSDKWPAPGSFWSVVLSTWNSKTRCAGSWPAAGCERECRLRKSRAFGEPADGRETASRILFRGSAGAVQIEDHGREAPFIEALDNA